MVGEFCGTFLFLFFAFAGTQVANTAAAANTDFNNQNSSGSLSQAPNAPVLLYISLVFGFSLAVNVWIFFRISGGRRNTYHVLTCITTDTKPTGLFNPAVCLALALVGAISWTRAGLVFIAEMLGAMASAGVVAALFPNTMAVQTTLGGSTSLVRGLCMFSAICLKISTLTKCSH